jgi:hypothetical protein
MALGNCDGSVKCESCLANVGEVNVRVWRALGVGRFWGTRDSGPNPFGLDPLTDIISDTTLFNNLRVQWVAVWTEAEMGVLSAPQIN